MSHADHDAVESLSIEMFESGAEQGSGFHVFNMGQTQYHRAEILQRTGAINITCTLEKVVHGIMSADSDRYATLVVMQWLFQPKGGSRRISEAMIELLFSGGPRGDDVEVENISFLDTYSLLPRTQEESITKRGEITAGVYQFASLSATGTWEKTVTKTTSHAMTLTGSKHVVNNRPPNRIATWRLTENPSQHSGIPASLRVAVLVSREDREPFSCNVSVTCKTDWATAAQSLFRKIPKDDPIIFQPDPRDEGIRPNKKRPAGAVLSPLPVLRREPGTKTESQAVPDANISSGNADDDQDGENQDAASIKTTTTDFFLDHIVTTPTANSSRQHRLGLDINEPWGWDGSSYNDYETAWTDAQGVWWVKDKLFKRLSTRQVDYSYEIDAASMLYEPGGIMQHARRLVTEYAAVRQKLEEVMAQGSMHGDLEDELHRLVLLPGSGPHLVDGILHKIKELSRQVIKVNRRFLATKLLDRAAILNVFAQTSLKSQNQDPVDELTTEVAAPNGNALLDIASVSRLFYLDHDSSRTQEGSGPSLVHIPRKSVIYFEFARHDSRYNTISSLLLYLINALVCHCWERMEIKMIEQGYSDCEYRLVLSTPAREDLTVPSFPDEARINLDDSPALSGVRAIHTEGLKSHLNALIAMRPVLAEALVVRELSDGEEPSFEDMDVGRTMREIEEALGGILTSEMDGDVKFSHPSFYHAPEVGFEERGADATAKAHSTIAETCLRYFHLGCAQETLAAFSRENMSPEGIPSSNPLDSAIISCPRTSMGAYAVRFWHQHYSASGRFKPKELVEHLFASKEARAAWEVSFWLLSNPFTRLQRSYVSTLPVFAMLGLEDLVQEKAQIERHRPTFNKDCWLAITEAARAGRRAMVQRLLELTVAVDEEELQAGLYWAAGRGDAALVNILLDKIPEPKTFHWPDNMIHQATAAGLTDLLVTMLRSGCNINEICECYWGAPPVGIAAFRQRVSTMEVLVHWEDKPDLDMSIGGGAMGNYPLFAAAEAGSPLIVGLLLKAGADFELRNGSNEGPVHRAAQRGNHRVIEVLIKAGADFKSCTGGVWYARRPLINAADSGSEDIPGDPVDEHGRGRLHAIQETTPVSIVQGLVEANAPIDIQDEEGHTPLSVAVSKDNELVARYLVKQGARVNRFSPLFGSILHLAVSRGNLDMARFLVDSGADLDTVDPAYGESLLYTALGIEDHTKLKAMVRYLVDDARAPINRPGGAQFSYPIIRAAHLAIHYPSTGTDILKFLIRRNAQLEVSDSQGRRAVHIACASSGSDTFKALVGAGANVDVKDALGRMPIHFAASQPYGACFEYLLDTFKETDINAADSDKWTPLMWAARSGAISTLSTLVERNADVWTRGYGSDGSVAWSALKLLNFSGRGSGQDLPRLEPEERTRVGPDGQTEEWDDDFHKTRIGDPKGVICNSCCVIIRGIQWECGMCNDGFSLCFKCYGHRTTVHHPEHEFNSLGRLYAQPMTTSELPRDKNGGDAGGNVRFPGESFADLEPEHFRGGGDETSQSHGGSDDETLWFDIDGGPNGSEED
ncbi:hypothetical protein NEMBOFW57_009020 [Staphylotrichum longicolle]|uniref:C2H2-type domain-containing protein n=1 Tax=Staphylotrichum longicolle TaxID=669026 RepID=A0AAD4ESF9_9PEZI|nr:hypothetical protein NEMBOFW57_009020 [Staphylotrichum longicolle]